ncbi:uncharacterized protein C10orf143 homolog isoform X1 [Bubalus bubalis]|uniref:uncharacterized protein C10orf143 homolog isoform X1 n=1 Tax=Bubalus bubalis TaxID=89462 RepID=UPI001E1B9259|nr:uncharacterized protein C10orf143 homolog isoform X1 [Bubalus bubalis]
MRAWAGRAHPLGRSTVGGAWMRRTAPPTAPAQRCGPGRAVCARLGGAWVGRVAPQDAPAQRCRPGHLGVLETQGWSHGSGLLRRPQRFSVQSQGSSRLLRAAVPESNRHVQALGWVWYGCQASRHSSRLLRKSRKRACRRLDTAAPERDCPQLRVRIPASGGSEEPESLDAQRRGYLPSLWPDSGQGRLGMGGPLDGGRSRAQPCPRCIAGESGHFNHTEDR